MLAASTTWATLPASMWYNKTYDRPRADCIESNRRFAVPDRGVSVSHVETSLSAARNRIGKIPLSLRMFVAVLGLLGLATAWQYWQMHRQSLLLGSIEPLGWH